MKIAILAATVCVISACAPQPSSQQLRDADYGGYPAKYKEIGKRYVQDTAIEPESIQYYWKQYATPIQVYDEFAGPAYGFCVQLNGKNSFGGYTGKRWAAFVIKDGTLIDSSFVTGGGESPGFNRCKKWGWDV